MFRSTGGRSSTTETSVMKLEFTKMHGLGNDFVVIDAVHQTVHLGASRIRFVANRRLGVGCDQLLLVERPQSHGADFRYRIFNADGSEVEQCGNGARCFARFVRDKGMIGSDRIRVETAAGMIVLQEEEDGQISVDMGPPRLDPAEIPFEADGPAISYDLQVEGLHLQIGVVSMGNPHAVVPVETVRNAPVERLGPQLESHPRFPQRTNVEFMEVVDRGAVRLRVYERGVGETLACGTGACAAVVTGRLQGLLDEQVEVDLPGGRLMIRWGGGNRPVIMTGPATSVFEGTIDL